MYLKIVVTSIGIFRWVYFNTRLAFTMALFNF